MSASAKTSAGGAGKRRRFPCGRGGTTSLEFALVGSLLMSLLLGSIEIGRYMLTLESVRTATAEAVRLVILRGSQNMNAGIEPCANLSGNLAGAGAQAPFLRSASLIVTMNGCATQAGITTVAITVDYPFIFGIPLFGVASRPLTEAAQAVFN
ncbi:TadE/TadG family type IV pilus assembly protein [Dankookia sp. GCM10030260]|uniref:TadE/TadG family type IV pilus assembly protein n=1 Tax=Dankookia sp. GCM10030260 TaxID=3273390 RepID=UPI0036246771